MSYCTRENRKIIRASVLLVKKKQLKLKRETEELKKILNVNSSEITEIGKILNSNKNSSEMSCDCAVHLLLLDIPNFQMCV